MGKGGKGGPGDRKSQTAKAGKRHGTVNYPAPISSERLAAKEQGERQFIAPKQLTAQLEKTIIDWDKQLKKFVYRTKTVTVSTEYTFDKNRGRIVYSPSFKEKSK